MTVPWTAKTSNQSILKEISPGCSLEGLLLKLKLQYVGHLMRRTDSFEKTLVLGKIEGRRRRGRQRMRWLDGITDSMDMCVCVKSLSRVQLFATPWTVARQAPLSMGFSRQEDWSGMLFPSPGDLPDPGIEPRSPALQADSLPAELPGNGLLYI